MNLNLYRVSQSENDDYDTYDSFVVAAKDEETARHTHPRGHEVEDLTIDGDWIKKCLLEDCVEVKLIGVAHRRYTKTTIICASFNAG